MRQASLVDIREYDWPTIANSLITRKPKEKNRLITVYAYLYMQGCSGIGIADNAEKRKYNSKWSCAS